MQPTGFVHFNKTPKVREKSPSLSLLTSVSGKGSSVDTEPVFTGALPHARRAGSRDMPQAVVVNIRRINFADRGQDNNKRKEGCYCCRSC